MDSIGIFVDYAGYKSGNGEAVARWEAEFERLEELHHWQEQSIAYQAAAAQVKQIADQSRDVSTTSEAIETFITTISTGISIISLATSTTWLGAARVVAVSDVSAYGSK